MFLLEKINGDLKQAMREKNKELVSVLRMLVSAIRNREIALRQGDKTELADEQTAEVIAGEIKKRKDSAAIYEQGGRQDLAEKEKWETATLEKYLPPQLSEEEIEKTVAEVIKSMGGAAADFGKAMGQAMAKLKGKADGTKVGEIVKKVLSNN